jgi:hypothetical protein
MRGEAFARQLKLLALLEVRREGVELEEAAAELGAQRRTVYRDLRVLEDAGFPLTSARDGRRARWRMLEGYRHRLQLTLTWSELVALMAARQMMSGLAGTMLHDGAASALDKIRATLPRGLADHVRGAERLVSAPEGGRDYSARGELVRRLVEAIDTRQTVAARYRSRGAKRQRRADGAQARSLSSAGGRGRPVPARALSPEPRGEALPRRSLRQRVLDGRALRRARGLQRGSVAQVQVRDVERTAAEGALHRCGPACGPADRAQGAPKPGGAAPERRERGCAARCRARAAARGLSDRTRRRSEQDRARGTAGRGGGGASEGPRGAHGNCVPR